MLPLPDKRYQIIYADPPWEYKGRMKGADDEKWNQGPHRHYPCIPTANICKIPIHGITDNDCLLFLWVTNSHIEDALQVGNAWGFRYKTVGFVWDKQRATPGYYTMGQCELCLVFKHGRIPQPRGARNIHQFLSVKRGKHSEKPDTIRNRIVEMFPEQSKIELFAREHFEGWDAWGLEVDNKC